ncbi:MULTISPECIES: GGDEF domain-containing protein [unclassified Methylophilus]|uniref:GGDEF domain-containing protein n=1 Tax=unclassified Methylophilus TaxID=2630143 RepID=UPI0003601F32|nr:MULTISPECIES: GGDEF domain-containing protein [unclassified Methylophilus]
MLKKWISQALAVMLRPIKFFPELSEADNVRYKVVFLNNVFAFSGIVSLSMGIIRWNLQPFIGRVDLVSAFLAFGLLWVLYRYQKNIELIASTALWLCFMQFLTVFFMGMGTTTRSALLLLILAAAFYLKGRVAGYYMLALLLILVISNHVMGIFPSEYSNLDILSLCLYLLAQFFIIRNYECLRESQTSHLKALNTDLEALVKQRTEQLAAANTALEIEKENLKTLSSTDHLTGLSNRHHFETVFAEHTPAVTRRKISDALILIDIDHFKKINDSHGHVLGDVVLKSVASCIKKHSRISDITVRWGGDELIIYAPRTTLKQATQLAEKVRHQINAMHLAGVGNITISAGVAVLHPGDNLSQLLQRADQALYEAKQAGRNSVYAAALD